MNPQTTWDQLLAAYAAGNWNQIDALSTALLDWLDRGGFPPAVSQNLDNEWNHALARAGCQFALDAVRTRWSCTSPATLRDSLIPHEKGD